MDVVESVWKNKQVTGLRRLFYLVSPNETSFEKLEEVPLYVEEAAPYFMLTLFLENLILLAKKMPTMRPNDGFSSIAHGLLSLMHSFIFRGIELATYIWIYERFCIYTLPWESSWTWLLTMLGVDLGYYWVHRFGHEVNIMWAGHQVHHSSEDYNLSTALRQSMFHRYITWVFYLPLALFIPPSQFQVHLQFNLIYQFWIHTELINTIGPLEWIFNTPSHHRVHHGRNPYCIDKNYAGVFIIWDRIFGTFQPEKEKVVYGLVHPLTTWDPLYGQVCHLLHIGRMMCTMNAWQDKLSVIWKGPGWMPGKPRLGLYEDLPQVEFPAQKYDSSLPWWGSLYVWVHFLLLTAANSVLALRKNELSAVTITTHLIFLVFTLFCFGSLFDNRGYGPGLEMTRCIIYLLIASMYQPVSLQLSAFNVIFFLFLASVSMWCYLILRNFQLQLYKKKRVE